VREPLRESAKKSTSVGPTAATAATSTGNEGRSPSCLDWTAAGCKDCQLWKRKIENLIGILYYPATFFRLWAWWGRKSLHFILGYEARFTKPNHPQSPPSHLVACTTCNNARFVRNFCNFFWSVFWSKWKGAWKIVYTMRSLSLQSSWLWVLSSVITTAQRLLLRKISCLDLIMNNICLIVWNEDLGLKTFLESSSVPSEFTLVTRETFDINASNSLKNLNI